jgi:hypothetical protein
MAANLYKVRTAEGNEIGPFGLSQLEDMIKHGVVVPTTMIFVQGPNRWHLATALPEIRELLKQFHVERSRAKAPEAKPSSVRQGESLSSLIKKASSQAPVKDPRKKNARTPGDLYTIRTGDGVEHQSIGLKEVQQFVKEDRIKATTMVLTQSTQRWHLAASVPEIRKLLRQYNPSQNSVLNRLRSMGAVHSRDSANRFIVEDEDLSAVRMRRSLWKKLFQKD